MHNRPVAYSVLDNYSYQLSQPKKHCVYIYSWAQLCVIQNTVELFGSSTQVFTMGESVLIGLVDRSLNFIFLQLLRLMSRQNSETVI